MQVHSGKIQFEAARIIDDFRILATNTIDRTVQFWFGNFGHGTADAKPSTGVDDQQTAVRIFQNISGMKVGIVTGKEFFFLCRKRGS